MKGERKMENEKVFDQIKYQNEYKKKNYDRIEITVPKGEKALIKKAAETAGQSVSEYINEAIRMRGEREMTDEKRIELLMKDGDTRSEAEKHLKAGAIVFEDLDKNLESYLDEWDTEEEDREEYRKMVTKHIPVAGWGVVEEEGNTYYIMYVL